MLLVVVVVQEQQALTQVTRLVVQVATDYQAVSQAAQLLEVVVLVVQVPQLTVRVARVEVKQVTATSQEQSIQVLVDQVDITTRNRLAVRALLFSVISQQPLQV
jgi:hypothetical protein